MKFINYLFFRLMVSLFALIPFKILYKISNAVSFLLLRVIKYRLSTVSENINRVFPQFTYEEKSDLKKKIYRNLSDIMIEGFKGFSINEKQIKQRHKCVNGELLAEAYKKNKSVILVTGHYANWEWGAFSPNFFIDHTVVGFFKPFTNRYINAYVINKRAQYGTVLADINDTSKVFENRYKKNSLFLLAADQSPTKPELALWIDFMGVKTPCLHGIEKYVERYQLPVVFCEITRVKRGFYEIRLEWITDSNSAPKAHGKTTEIFMNKLEKVIYKKPEDWLWSHRRWKHIDYLEKQQ